MLSMHIRVMSHLELSIFFSQNRKDELAQMIDAYGGASDLTVVESVLSLLTFVEPIGVEARRVAHLRLADATDGYHAQMLISFADPESPYYSSNWMKRANLTVSHLSVDLARIILICAGDNVYLIMEDYLY